MGPLVTRWTGREARALRQAMRESVRTFGGLLGINAAAVSNWETRGPRANLRFETQQLLDTVLRNAPDEVQARFALLTRQSADDALNSQSAERTKALLESDQHNDNSRVSYVPDDRGAARFQHFVDSPSRVFVITGPPGSGKTQLTRHVIRALDSDVDYQLHAVDSWDLHTADLAVEILRYASLPGGDDSLLTLERACEGLRRPCVIVVDGTNNNEQLDWLARQVDAILRQVPVDILRFALAVRTPPDVDLSAYPVLAASVYEPASSRAPWASHVITPWELTAAQNIWNQSRMPDEPTFADLPVSVQTLTRIPLYMQLLKTSGDITATTDFTTFRLVDHCVRAILHQSGRTVDHAIAQLAHVAHHDAPHLVPAVLIDTAHAGPDLPTEPDTSDLLIGALVQSSPDGRRTVFVHDVIREYVLAVHIARLIIERGRTMATLAAINELAANATTSATARGLFEFVIHAIDTENPEFVAALAVAPTITVDTALPLTLRLAANGARFATDDVLRTCAKRCTHEAGLELARALLALPALTQALNDQYAPWVLSLLRRFGSRIWTDVAGHIEQTMDIQAITPMLAAVNLDRAEEAIFLARHLYLFITGDRDQAELLELLLGHLDWRVRAALAESLLMGETMALGLARRIARQLVNDDDYKVRATIAEAIGLLPATIARPHLTTLLTDDNWHVRARLLEGVLAIKSNRHPDPSVRSAAVHSITSEAGWSDSPDHVARLLERLMLLEQKPAIHAGIARERALFRLLREQRTGWTTYADPIRDALLAEGAGASNWLVRRESDAIKSEDLVAETQLYRRHRGEHLIQVALDVDDLDRATMVAISAAEAGADLIEIGDPLIKRMGLAAVEQIKRHVPDTTIVAEMMSADWGRDQVELAIEAGADVVLLIGPASTASVSAATGAARRLGAAIVLDVPAVHLSQVWVRDMERAGVDGFTVTTNIDLGIGVSSPLAAARLLRGWTRLPVSVSGGFSATDHAIINSNDWDILIVGRSISEAVRPRDAAHQLLTLIHQRGARRTSARDTT